MWLWYDWQAAAVADNDGLIHDLAVWDGYFDQRAVIERLHCIANGGLIQEALLLQERFPEAKPVIHGDDNLPDADWPLPSKEALDALDRLRMSWPRRVLLAQRETLTGDLSTCYELATKCGQPS